MIKDYSTYIPSVTGSVEEEWEQCLKKLSLTCSKTNTPLKINVFTDQPDYTSYLKVKKFIDCSVLETFGDRCPAITVLCQPPERPWKIIAEAGFIDTSSGEIVSKVLNSIPYVVRKTESIKEVWAGGLGASLFVDDTLKAAVAAFEQMRSILAAEQISFDHIVRQWNYIGNILEVKNEVQNYQKFNEVRSEYYHKYRNVHSYPAATGIGMKFGGVILDFCAVKAQANLKIIAVDNPDQIRPYDYSQQVLKGKPLCSKGINQPPQFERALFLTENMGSTLFVSGTASIIGQDTIGINDIEKQTIVTLDNISKLTDSERISHLSGEAGSDAGNPILLRVYIKNQEDFTKVKAICDQRYPRVPSIFIEADICRDNLLIEIEAEFLISH
jgi:enamine deaminase RidA (YjgF/YER057c/UK114 family)